MTPKEQIQITLSDFEKTEEPRAGAAGEVWKARVTRPLPFAGKGDFVALKLYRQEILKEPAQRERIAQEFKTGSRLVHPNLVKIFHVHIEHDAPFLVMEWCEGHHLLAWRQKNLEPDEEFLLQFSTQILDVLEFLHSSRRLHRDVKPTNIHIDTKGRMRLMDYGIIRSLREPAVTPSDARFVGTYRYSAPEYIFENSYTYSADLYSFGAVLYFLLHGREIFGGVNRTVDIINAKKSHKINFDPRIQERGSVWAALYDLSQQLLEQQPSRRPSSAMACLDILAKAVSVGIPFRVYFACALTRGDPSRRQHTEKIGKIVRGCGEQKGYSVYLPGEHTHPLGAPDLSAPEVYWIDRERVAGSDLLLILADDPSFGVGQEAEIASNAGVPIAIFHSKGVDVSRMLRGIAGRIIAQIEFVDDLDLESKVTQFFSDNKGRLQLSRRSREREYHQRVGNRLREIRTAENLTTDDLAHKAEVSRELVESLETRPEQLSNISIVNLRRIARSLNVPPAEFLKEQSGKDQQFEDLYRSSLATLRSFARNYQLSYEAYAKLKVLGRDALHAEIEASAARGIARSSPQGLQADNWRKLYNDPLDRKLEDKSASTQAKD